MRTSLDIEDELRRRLGKLADARSLSPNGMIDDAIRQYLDREEARDDFKQEALKSWSEFRRNGLHLTGQEAHDWLDTWCAEGAQGRPECHK